MIVSFRPTPRIQSLLQRLARETGKTKTGIICEAIEKLPSRLNSRSPVPRDYFAEWAPVIGCFRGPKDLSTNKKKYITQVLEAKRARNAR